MFGFNVSSHTIYHFAGAIHWCDTACSHFSNFVVYSLTLPLLEIALTVTDAIGKAGWNHIIYLLSDYSDTVLRSNCVSQYLSSL